MRILNTFGLIALLLAPAMAEASDSYKAQARFVADVITSADTCSQIGYDVDFDGIMKLRSRIREAAIADGMDPAEVDRIQEDEIESKYEWLSTKFKRADRMVEDSPNRVRHRRFWQKRCKKLSEKSDTSDLFVKAQV